MATSALLLAITLAGSGADTTVRLPRNGAIEVESRNRDVVIRTGPTDIVTIHGGSAELDGGTLQISGDDRRSRPGALDITLPTWARVEVSSVSGNLTFTNAPDRLHAETVAGFIHLTGGNGTVELETVAGPVVINDFHGTSLSIDATGGPVNVTNATGRISADNVNGNVVLRGIRSANVTAGTVNGGVEFEGPLAAGGRYEFSSQNEDVTLIVPGDVSARMRVSTMNGQLISPQIPATTGGSPEVTSSAQGGKVKTKDKGHDHADDGEHTFTVVYGSGAAQVSVDVFNGNVVVRKAGAK